MRHPSVGFNGCRFMDMHMIMLGSSLIEDFAMVINWWMIMGPESP